MISICFVALRQLPRAQSALCQSSTQRVQHIVFSALHTYSYSCSCSMRWLLFIWVYVSGLREVPQEFGKLVNIQSVQMEVRQSGNIQSLQTTTESMFSRRVILWQHPSTYCTRRIPCSWCKYSTLRYCDKKQKYKLYVSLWFFRSSTIGYASRRLQRWAECIALVYWETHKFDEAGSEK